MTFAEIRHELALTLAEIPGVTVDDLFPRRSIRTGPTATIIREAFDPAKVTINGKSSVVPYVIEVVFPGPIDLDELDRYAEISGDHSVFAALMGRRDTFTDDHRPWRALTVTQISEPLNAAASDADPLPAIRFSVAITT